MRNTKRMLLLLILASIIGCGQPSGGGSAAVDGRKVCYGIGKNGITFILYTDLPSDSRAGTSSPSGIASAEASGFVQSSSGTRVDYAGNSESITIAGTKYTFAEGRVFLVSVSDKDVVVQQLNMSIKSTALSTDAMKQEIQRIAREPDVAAFVEKAINKDE